MQSALRQNCAALFACRSAKRFAQPQLLTRPMLHWFRQLSGVISCLTGVNSLSPWANRGFVSVRCDEVDYSLRCGPHPLIEECERRARRRQRWCVALGGTQRRAGVRAGLSVRRTGIRDQPHRKTRHLAPLSACARSPAASRPCRRRQNGQFAANIRNQTSSLMLERWACMHGPREV